MQSKPERLTLVPKFNQTATVFHINHLLESLPVSLIPTSLGWKICENYYNFELFSEEFMFCISKLTSFTAILVV